jgi:hypothetical protein
VIASFINLQKLWYLPALSSHCKYTCIIENRQRGTSMPNDMEQAHIKMIGQADNEHLDISFIYYLFSFLF